MGLYNNVPLFLDNNAGFTEAQVEKINLIVRTTRNRFLSQAKQNQLEKPTIEKFVTTKYNRVLNLRDYLYNKNFSVSFILDPAGFEPNISYPLFDFDYNIDYFHFEGSNSDELPAALLSSLGQITIDRTGQRPRMMFEKNSNAWPVDEFGNKVKYSVYISGKIK